MHPRHYRLRFAIDVLKNVFAPPILLAIVFSLCRSKLGTFFRVTAYALSVPAAGALRTWYKDRRDRAALAALGAIPIPRVRGKWPGNLDIVLGFVQSLRDDYPMQFMDDLFEQYGCKTLNLRMLWEDQTWTIDDAHVKYLLTGPGFEWFNKGYYWQERFESLLGNGIFNRDHEEWKAHRNIARPWFAKDRVSDLTIFDHHTNATLGLMSTFARENAAFDAQDLFARFTLDSASEFLFGNCLNTLSGSLPIAGRAKMGPKGSSVDDEFGTFAWAFEDIQVQIARRTRIGKLWPLFELFRDKTSESTRIVQQWLQPIIQSALRQKPIQPHSETNGEEGTFLSHLTENTDDPETIGYQILNMLLAGRDTTASVLSFVVYFLAMFPDTCQRLRAEVLHAYGNDGLPSTEDMKELRYLRAVINETMRLFPPVPMNLRLSDHAAHAFPATLDTPRYAVPPNTVILYNTFLIQRRPDLWGADALEFRPERWLNTECAKSLAENPFMFHPFHAGPRLCLGQNFAYNEMSFFIIRMLQQIERFDLAPDAQPEGSLPPPRWKDGKGRQAIERIWPASSVTSLNKVTFQLTFPRQKK